MNASPRSRRASASSGRRRAGRRRWPAAALALALAAASTPALAARGRVTTAELAEEGLTDPRLAKLPRRHRFRLALVADYVRTTRACNADATRCTRFQFVPLTVDFAYQLQFLRYVSFRASLGLGPNVANSRHAMPFAIHPGGYLGVQTSLFGAGFMYSYILVVPARANADNGRGGLGEPLLWNDHLVQGELSLTTRIDRGALNFGLRVGGMKTHLTHYDLDRVRWFPVVTFSLGWFFGPRRQKETALPDGRQSQ